MSRVGESITFSAFTVIAALVSLVLAEFAFYQSLGPGAGDRDRADAAGRPDAAAGAAGDLRPGGVLADRRRRRTRATSSGLWDRIGDHRDAAAGASRWWSGIVLFVGARGHAADDGRRRLRRRRLEPRGTDSAAGSALIAAHFPSSNAGRSAVLLQFPKSVWDDPSVLATAQAGPARRCPSSAGSSGRSIPTASRSRPSSSASCTRPSGRRAQLPPVPTTHAVPAELYNAYRATGQLISPDGHTVQFSVAFANGDSSSPAVARRRARDARRRRPGGHRRPARRPTASSARSRSPTTSATSPGTDLAADHPDRRGPHRAAAGDRAAQPRRAALPGGEHRAVVPRRAGPRRHRSSSTSAARTASTSSCRS